MKVRVISTGSKGNAYIVEHNNTMLAIEAGIKPADFLRAVKYRPQEVGGVLVSHSHKDHSQSVAELVKQYYNVYASKETFKEAGITGNGWATAHTIGAGDNFKAGQWYVHAFKTIHDVEGSLGFYFKHEESSEKILFATDTGVITVSPIGMTCMLVECNHDDTLMDNITQTRDRFLRLKKHHMSLSRLLSYLDAIDTSALHTIVLLHMSDDNANEESMVSAVKRATGCNVYSARDGMDIVLDQIPF